MFVYKAIDGHAHSIYVKFLNVHQPRRALRPADQHLTKVPKFQQW